MATEVDIVPLTTKALWYVVSYHGDSKTNISPSQAMATKSINRLPSAINEVTVSISC